MTSTPVESHAEPSPVVDVAPTAAPWRHLPALDGLRAAAVIAVLVFHGGYLQGGFLGVDLFFALSGFLITSLLIRDAEGIHTDGGHGVRLGRFWGRRFRRLLPAVLVMITLVALWSWWFGSAADQASVKGDGIWSVYYVANWHYIAEAGDYWQSFTQPSMFDHLWSLAIEEQFYLLWPLVIVAIWRWSKRPTRTLLVLSAVGIAASFMTMLLLYDGANPTRVYMGTDTRAASLLVGAVAATPAARALARRVVGRLGPRLGIVLLLLAAAIVWSWFAVDGATSEALFRGGLLAHSVACAVLIGLVAAADRNWFGRGLGWAPLAWIGVMSYGLYLWHWPIYVMLTPSRTGLDGLALLAVRIAVSVVAAYVSFRVVEDPIRRRAAWARGRSGIAALVGAFTGVTMLLVFMPRPPVEIAAFDPGAIAAPVTTVGDLHDDPDNDLNGDGGVVPAPPSSPPTTAGPAPTTTEPVPLQRIESVMWAGDSVAYELAPGVVASLTAAGLEVDDLAAYYGYRLVADGADYDLSLRIPERAGEVGADLVLMSISLWDGDRPASDDEFRDVLTRVAADLEPLDATLVVVATPPTGDDDLNRELDRLFGVATELADDELTNLEVLDPRPIWGAPGTVDLENDGVPERKPDQKHICPAGAARFGAWLASALAERYDGVEPGDPAVWADALWVFDKRFDQPVGSCASL